MGNGDYKAMVLSDIQAIASRTLNMLATIADKRSVPDDIVYEEFMAYMKHLLEGSVGRRS